jgi:hypothetical protein
VQNDEAKKLAAEWSARVAKDPSLVCHHPLIVREFFLGGDTGDKVCTTCGLAATRNAWTRTETGHAVE